MEVMRAGSWAGRGRFRMFALRGILAIVIGCALARNSSMPYSAIGNLSGFRDGVLISVI